MRTALELDDQLLREAERAAARSGRSVSALVEDLLRAELAREKATPGAKPANGKNSAPFKLPSFSMGLPAVDLSDGRAVRDFLDDQQAEELPGSTK